MNAKRCFRECMRALSFVNAVLLRKSSQIATVLVATAGICSAQEEEQHLKEVLALQKQFARVPDCRIEYRTVHQNGSHGVRQYTHRYIKKAPYWKHQSFEESGRIYFQLSFDGEKYYAYRPTANYLYVGHDPIPITSMIAEAHGKNPLFAWVQPFFFGKSDHLLKMPDLAEPSAWREALESLTVVPMYAADPRKRRFQVYNGPLVYEIVMQSSDANPMVVTEMRTTRHRLPSMADMVTRVSYSGWTSVPVGNSSVFVPMRTRAEVRWKDGRPVPNVGSWSEVIPGSIAPAPDDLEVASFRVPLKFVSKPIVVAKGEKFPTQNLR